MQKFKKIICNILKVQEKTSVFKKQLQVSEKLLFSKKLLVPEKHFFSKKNITSLRKMYISLIHSRGAIIHSRGAIIHSRCAIFQLQSMKKIK